MDRDPNDKGPLAAPCDLMMLSVPSVLASNAFDTRKGLARMFCRSCWLLAIAFSLLASAPNVLAAKKFEYGYPDYGHNPTLFVSKDHISTLTETPAGDHLIPGTQAFLGRDVSEKSSLNPMMYFGLIGALAAIGSESSKNKKQHDGMVLMIDQLHFSDAVECQLSAHLVPFASSLFRATTDEKAADVIVLPSSRLNISKDDTASINFQLNVRIKDPKTGKTSRRTYVYASAERMAMNDHGGWFSAGGEPIVRLSRHAFDILTEALAHDMNNQLFSDELIGGKYELTSCNGLALAKTFGSVHACVPIVDRGPSPFLVILLEVHAPATSGHEAEP